MDAFITFSIVAIAVLWAGSRLVKRFGAKRESSCGSCTGCPTSVRTSGLPSGCSSEDKRRNVIPVVLGALALAVSPCLFAQSAIEETPDDTAEPPNIGQEIEKLKTTFESLSGGISIEGFFDMQAATRGNDPNIFSAGDFEFDLARDLGSNAQIAAALVANDEGTSVAVGFVDFHFFGGLIAPRGRLPVEKGLRFWHSTRKRRSVAGVCVRSISGRRIARPKWATGSFTPAGT